MTIYERIKKRRKELNLTADYVADVLNVSRATIYRYESSNIEKLPTTILEPLSKVLRTTPAYLMGWESEPNTMNLTKKQFDLINKYENLDEKGKHTIDTLLNLEYTRCEKEKQNLLSDNLENN